MAEIQFPVEELFAQLKRGDRGGLARAITLVESTRAEDSAHAMKLLDMCYGDRSDSLRVGITGVPGVGKSTYIDTLGMHLIERGKKVAVLAVDPTSERTGGSILGDKTRMERLSLHENAFVRPTASGTHLGGVALATRKNIVLLEAAGYDVILVETVGVGQSETEVSQLVDFFLLMLLPGGGDELQGIKRGVMELANGIVVNKADILADEAKKTCAEYKAALHLMHPLVENWNPPVMSASAVSGEGVSHCWDAIEKFRELQLSNSRFHENRLTQYQQWLERDLKAEVLRALTGRLDIQTALEKAMKKIGGNSQSPFAAQKDLISSVVSQLGS